MPIEVVIPRPQLHEYASVRDLIEIVATETFKDLLAPNPVQLNTLESAGVVRLHGPATTVN